MSKAIPAARWWAEAKMVRATLGLNEDECTKVLIHTLQSVAEGDFFQRTGQNELARVKRELSESKAYTEQVKQEVRRLNSTVITLSERTDDAMVPIGWKEIIK